MTPSRLLYGLKIRILRHFRTKVFPGGKKKTSTDLVNLLKRNAYYTTCRICGFQLNSVFLHSALALRRPPSCSLALSS